MWGTDSWEIHNAEIEDACQRLVHEVIPSVAADLDSEYSTLNLCATPGGDAVAAAAPPLPSTNGSEVNHATLNVEHFASATVSAPLSRGSTESYLTGAMNVHTHPPVQPAQRHLVSPKSLKVHLHTSGVNLRDVGRVRDHSVVPYVRMALISHAFARTVASLVRRAARSLCFGSLLCSRLGADSLHVGKTGELDALLETEQWILNYQRKYRITPTDPVAPVFRFRVITLLYLNSVLLSTVPSQTIAREERPCSVTSEHRERFWELVREAMLLRFDSAMSEDELASCSVSSSLVMLLDLSMVAESLVEFLGISVRLPSLYGTFSVLFTLCVCISHWNSDAALVAGTDHLLRCHCSLILPQPLTLDDIFDVRVQTKGIRVVSFVDSARQEGRKDKVYDYYWNEVAIREHALGFNHPYVATPLENLAELFSSDGRFYV